MNPAQLLAQRNDYLRALLAEIQLAELNLKAAAMRSRALPRARVEIQPRVSYEEFFESVPKPYRKTNDDRTIAVRG